MLLRLILRNFLSFNGLEQFELFPNPKRTTLNSHIYDRGENPQVLKMTAVYGANGAGKSNLVKALSFIRRFVLDDSFLDADNIKNWKFRLKPESEEPILIAIEYEAVDKEVYFYTAEIGDSGVQKETLRTSGTKHPGEMIFERCEGVVTFRDAITEEVSSIVDNWVQQHPFSSLFTVNSSVRLLKDKAINASRAWMGDKLKVVGLNSFHPDIITRLKNNPEQLRFASEMFREIGLGLSGLEVKTEDFDQWLASNPHDEKILTRTEKMPEDMVLSEIVDNRTVSAISLENGIRKVSHLVFEQAGVEGYSAKMGIQSQSDGTVRLLILAPYLYAAVHEGMTLVIDELDNSIHPHLVRGLVKYFAEADSNGQLVFTTHETCVLSQSILRPDEVWFVEKSQGESHPYSLNEFKIHNTISIENGYLAGRFGAVPFIGSLDF